MRKTGTGRKTTLEEAKSVVGSFLPRYSIQEEVIVPKSVHPLGRARVVGYEWGPNNWRMRIKGVEWVYYLQFPNELEYWIASEEELDRWQR